MKLFIHPRSPNARKPRAVARHLGLAVQEEEVDVRTGAHRRPEYLAINPNAKVPVLVDGDHAIWESAAICIYLAGKRPEAGLLPTDAAGLADLVRWIAWNHAHLDPPIGRLVFQRLFAGDAADAEEIERATSEARRWLAVLDRHLADRDYVLGNAITVADFVLAGTFTHARAAQAPLADFPQIEAWLARMEELPAWADTRPA